MNNSIYKICSDTLNVIDTYSDALFDCSSFYVKIDLSYDDEWIASGSKNGQVFCWDTTDSSLGAFKLSGHRAGTTAVSWSPRDLEIVSCSDDMHTRIWATPQVPIDTITNPLVGFVEETLVEEKPESVEENLVEEKPETVQDIKAAEELQPREVDKENLASSSKDVLQFNENETGKDGGNNIRSGPLVDIGNSKAMIDALKRKRESTPKRKAEVKKRASSVKKTPASKQSNSIMDYFKPK
jgi:WD40 repeat protein